jgi:outer membrane autotransporter protein
VDTDTVTVGSAVSFKASAYGARGEIGYRWAVSRFFIEPAASLTYVRADLDNYSTLQSTVNYDSAESLRGKAGVRIGGSWDSGAMGRVVPYVGVYAVHEYRGKDGAVFNNNGFVLPISNTAPGDFGEVNVGLDFQPTPGLSVFVQGDGHFDGDVNGSGLQAGVRFKW